MEENRLIIKAQNGDHDAFKDLMENHQAKVYRLLLGLLRDEHAAEEVTVETFIKAWRNLAGFRQESTFWTWLYRIAYRAAIDYQRRSLPEKNLTLLEENIVSKAAEPLEEVIAKDRNQELRQALQKISFPQRAAIILYYFQGLSYKEIGRIMQRPLGTIRADLHRGKKRLKELLTRQWRDDDGKENRTSRVGRTTQVAERI
ncbi:MAG: sigma-70 family RNA polymerase sigma factor [Firmicutes bacterium]|nr:sigma-70 family RNA polymerase sigma factor [Bacillota bacterium]